MKLFTRRNSSSLGPRIDQEADAIVDEIENQNIPPLGRRNNNRQLVTVLGFIFISCVGGGMLFVMMQGNATEGQARTVTPAKVDTAPPNFPKISFPEISEPDPLPVTETEPPQPVRQNLNSQAIPVRQYGQPHPATLRPSQQKTEPTWMDRKMNSGVIIKSQSASEGAKHSPATDFENREFSHEELFGKPDPSSPNKGARDLNVKLNPTKTTMASASLLPNRNFVITKGTTLDCVLETAVDSSLSGLTTCRLTRDIYSDNGHVKLLDRGTSLIGEYKGGLERGQVRLFVLWNRAKTPNGVIIDLNSIGTDSLGRTGLSGHVDNHFMKRFGAAILLSIVTDSVENLADNSGNGTNYYMNSADSGSKIVEKILDSTINIPPTLVKNQGEHIQVMVARDLSFDAVYDLALER